MMSGQLSGESKMNVHQWARQALAQQLDEAGKAGFEEALALRALLGILVEHSSQVREVDDLRQELLFLADNLNVERDYSFMRP
jgi:flagellar biosynthesis/type III secretory pathway protein FliH